MSSSKRDGDCKKCMRTYGTLGCCSTVNNEWLYYCDEGMEEWEMQHERMPKLDVLVIVDAQNDFIDGALGTDEAVEAVPRIVEKIRNFNGMIIATKDTHGYNYLDTKEGKHLPIRHCIIGTRGHEINADVSAALGEKGAVSLLKSTFGSHILWEGIKSIIKGHCDADVEDDDCEYDVTVELVGFCTDICVVSNALIGKALMPEIDIIVDSKCCAGTTPEAHNKALDIMRNCQIDII